MVTKAKIYKGLFAKGESISIYFINIKRLILVEIKDQVKESCFFKCFSFVVLCIKNYNQKQNYRKIIKSNNNDEQNQEEEIRSQIRRNRSDNQY